MAQPPLYIGVDVGGTTIKAGVVNDRGEVLGRAEVLTEPWRGQDEGLSRICEAAEGAAARAGVRAGEARAVGIATPGPLDLAAGVMLNPPNLKPWRNVPVRDHVARHFGLPTAFENDANAAALGESWVGAGRSARSLVLLTLGTGIGGGIVLDGAVFAGSHGHAGELGHTCIEVNGRPCGCGRRGCLEAYASATAVVARAEEALASGAVSSRLAQIRETEGELTARAVFEAAESGDAAAAAIVGQTAFNLAVGIVNAMHTVDPDLVLLGGGMAVGDRFLESIRRHVRELAFEVPGRHTEVSYALLGAAAGFIGAAACARRLVAASGVS